MNEQPEFGENGGESPPELGALILLVWVWRGWGGQENPITVGKGDLAPTPLYKENNHKMKLL